MMYQAQALEKLKNEKKAATYDRYAAIMKDQVCMALEEFCRQNEEFAQAVVQGGTFEACMKTVAKNCGTGISDLEAFRRAAAFYFDGASVQFSMTIRLDAPVSEQKDRGVMIDLTDFFLGG